jgi:hypothetical protein
LGRRWGSKKGFRGSRVRGFWGSSRKKGSEGSRKIGFGWARRVDELGVKERDGRK